MPSTGLARIRPNPAPNENIPDRNKTDKHMYRYTYEMLMFRWVHGYFQWNSVKLQNQKDPRVGMTLLAQNTITIHNIICIKQDYKTKKATFFALFECVFAKVKCIFIL